MERFHRKTSVFLFPPNYHTSTLPKGADIIDATRLSYSFFCITSGFFRLSNSPLPVLYFCGTIQQKKLFLLIGTAFTSSVRISISNFMLLENLWLWKCPSLFSACVSWHSELAIVCQNFRQNGSFLGSLNRTIDYIFSNKASIKKNFALVKVSSIWDSRSLFSMFESWHFKKRELSTSWIIEGTFLRKWNNFLQKVWLSSASLLEKNAVRENWFFMP